jgi:uncharacterized protein (DUF1778 family)
MHMKHRKPKGQRKEYMLRIRVTEEQKHALANAAAHNGLDVSAWVRALAVQAARRESIGKH